MALCGRRLKRDSVDGSIGVGEHGQALIVPDGGDRDQDNVKWAVMAVARA